MSASATESETSNDPILGKVIDGCKIQRKLGQGGMGVVYLAEHETLKQQFVIKILNPALVGAEDTVERFFREAQACAQLNHTGIVAIQNVGQEGEYYFIRMEYIQGKTLEETIKTENQIEWRRSVQIIIDTAESLSHAHQKGMIHRDIKPENIMLTPEGQVKVMDFGLAKHVHSNAKVSVTGQIVGTPFFMSPEQAGGKPTDARSDIYSLGVTLYYMVTGVKPFNGKNLQEIFLKHFFYAPESPKIYNGDLPESLCEVVKKCLKKKKKERYQSAKELARDLKAVLDDPDAVVAKDEPANESAAPEAAAAGATDEYGKTIRAKTGQEEGDRTVVAGGKTQEASTGEEADRTVRVGGATSDGTVKVDGEQGPTVRVEDDNDPTVAVKNRANTTGRLGDSVATVSFQDGKSVVINTQQLDADHPAAGLDLPTAVLEAGATQTPGDTTQPTRAGAARRASQRRSMIVGAVVLGPILVLGGMKVMAGQRMAGLQARYQEALDSKDPALMRQVAAEEMTAGLGSDDALIESMRQNLENAAAAEDLKRKDAEEIRKNEEARKKKEEEEQAQRKKLKDEAGARQKQMEELRTARDWPKFTEAALAFFRDYNVLLPDLTRSILLPVLVTTDPPGAELFVNSAPAAEAERTPGVAWVPPTREFKIKIRKRGFDEETITGDAKGFIEEKKELKRHVVRVLELGTIQRPIGTKQVAEARVPVSEPIVDIADGGTIYYVGIDGVLYAMGLRAKVVWPVRPSDHRVGCYGDPTPSPTLLQGQVVIVGSTMGTVSAHRPSNEGQRIWKSDADVGSPVTSAPAVGSNGKDKVACVGTASGDAVFVDVASGQILWRYRTENMVVSAPLVVGERAYVGSTDNRVHALDWARKQVLGTIDVGDDVISGPFALGRLLVVGTRDGVGHVLDVSDPAAIRRVATLGKPGAMSRDQGLLCVDDRIYLAAGRQVQAFGVGSNGAVTEVWSAPFECPAQVLRPTAEGDVLYVGAQNGILYALDRNTGEVLWKHAIPGASGSMTSSPFVVDDELFVIADGRVVVLEAE